MLSTSTSPPIDYGSDYELFDHQSGLFKEKRKRSSRACDQCRKTKSKCERLPGSMACRNCMASHLECTYMGPSRKRGPPKGYITTLEARVHRLEALWGVVLSARDSRAESLLADMEQDPLAREILGEVESGIFGPTGRNIILSSQHERDIPDSGHNNGRGFTSSRVRREQLALGNEEDPSLPSYRWQDRLVNHVVSRGIGRHPTAGSDSISAPYAFTPDDPEGVAEYDHLLKLPPVKRAPSTIGSGSHSPSNLRPQDAEMIWRTLYDPSMPSSGEESEYESDDPADAIGQLSLNEKQQVGFHGKTSGMHLLAKPNRSDSLNAGGIWHLPQTRFWPKSMRRRPMIEEDLNFDIRLPSSEEQHRLLELYWAYVQPVLPVLDKSKFLAEYVAEEKSMKPGQYHNQHHETPPPRVPRLLLLSMFTIAARYADTQPKPEEGNMWEAGCDYLDDAKSILNWTYDSPRPSTCQALILLAYREFGIGAISQAWIYMGMAIRMATDLGMHRAADRWQRSGRVLFTPAEKSSRKRLWYCCVILDRIMAFAMGRPMSIRERDYDTNLPSVDEGEEVDAWTPVPQTHNTPRPVRTLSTLNAAASLSSILALVVDTIYACRSGVSFVVRHRESFKIASLLDDWYTKIPQHLKYNLDAEQLAPLPHVLTLHMMYWCVVLLVHRPFIRHHKHTLAHSNVTEQEISKMSAQSLACSADAASRVSSLVHVYCQNWDIVRANAFVSWYVLSAGVMHVATLTMGIGSQPEAQIGLRRCLEAFDRMKLVWPSSARAWQLLRGAEIDLSTPKPVVGDHTINQSSARGPQGSYYAYPPGSTATSSYPQPTYTPHSTPVSGAFPSLTTTLGRDFNEPAPNMSYFPGYNHWPPESLVFDPPFLHDGQSAETYEDQKVPPIGAYDLTASMHASGLTAPTEMSSLNMGHASGNEDPSNSSRAWQW